MREHPIQLLHGLVKHSHSSVLQGSKGQDSALDVFQACATWSGTGCA